MNPPSIGELKSTGISFFDNLKERTGGMLRAGIYRKMYQLSLEQGRHSVIDIGVGQGPSSIAFALGIIHSGREGSVHVIDQFTQRRRGPHRFSETEAGDQCREWNLQVFKQHLHHCGVSDRVQVWAGMTNEVASLFDPAVEADILSIDADGEIDRDLRNFSGNVSLGAWIIIDDYADKINRAGRRHIDAAKDQNTDVRVQIGDLPRSRIRHLAGKHLLTFLLANEIEKTGFMVQKQVLGSTAFYVKTAPGAWQGIPDEVQCRIEAHIADRFAAEVGKARRSS